MIRRSQLLQAALSRPSASGYVCLRCQVHAKRRISERFLARAEEGRKQWAEWAKEIKAGDRQGMLSFLESRGFVHALAGERGAIDKLMNNKRIGVYCGVDPTAASLHVGHMLPLMVLFWMYLHGFHTVLLLGGSTARVGDPTGRTASRSEMTTTERKANMASMHYQMKRLWVNLEAVGRKYGYTDDTHWKRELVNNATWWNKMPFLDVLKYMGKGLRLGPMLSRDTVKTKLESGDGMSFAEFCYPIMQSWDFWRLYEEKGIQMQIGGQDQFGNIVSGIDAVKYVLKTHPDPEARQPDSGLDELKVPYGLTTPLLTTAAGEKFGKSAGNAIWLDTQLTSIFDLYGFFVRTADADIERYLKLFTFLPLPKIQSIMDKNAQDPSKRLAQHTLAFEFVELVHGQAAARDAAAQHEVFFRKDNTLSSLIGSAKPPHAGPTQQKDNPLLHNRNAQTREKGTFLSPQLNPFANQTNAETSAGQTQIILPRAMIYEQPISRVLYAAGLVSSRSEGHRLAQNQGAYIGHESGVSKNLKKGQTTEMNDQLSFTPAKLHDKSMTWQYVIKNQPSPESSTTDPSTWEKGPADIGLLILRSGKWKVRVCRIVSDERFAELQATEGVPSPPGWEEFQSEEMKKKNVELWEELEEDKLADKRGWTEEMKKQQRLAKSYMKKEGLTREESNKIVWQVWEKAKRGGDKMAAKADAGAEKEVGE